MKQGRSDRPVLHVLAGVNGAGKSSIGGALLRHRSLDYLNPDEFARRAVERHGLDVRAANAEAWRMGREMLERAIAERRNHAFETTLGGNTIPALIGRAASGGHLVHVWYCGLASPELHIQRVAERVAAGGHDIPAELIRRRWTTSRRNLIALMPDLAELRVYDNSRPIDPATGDIPPPIRVLDLREGRVRFPGQEDLSVTPAWARAIVEAALRIDPGHARSG